MILSELTIKNFRSFKNETITLDNYNCFVGPNGAGKSTILTALNIFFRNSVTYADSNTLDLQDFHFKKITEPIIIQLVFIKLTAEEKEEFKHYYRSDKLVISAKAFWKDNSAEIKYFGERLVMEEFAHFFEALKIGEKVTALKKIYRDLKNNIQELESETTKDGMIKALREYEENNPDKCTLVESEDKFYGVQKAPGKLDKYIQWIYIPAVKEAAEEQLETKDSAIAQLLMRNIRNKINFDEKLNLIKEETEKSYAEMLESENSAFKNIAQSLKSKFENWGHPNGNIELQWDQESDKAIQIKSPVARISAGEDNFLGDISRLGHGLQRSFIMALLQELFDQGNESSNKQLILAIEEPELYQHPPQAYHISNILEELSEDPRNKTQVMLTTHSPYFVSSKEFENLKRVIKIAKESKVFDTNYDKIADSIKTAIGEPIPDTRSSMQAKIQQIMNSSKNEMYFCNIPIFLEGVEDIAYLSTQLVLMNKLNEFRRFGCHFIICDGKTNMSRPIAIAKDLNFKCFGVFDSDSNSGDKDSKKSKRDNRCIINLLGNVIDKKFEVDLENITEHIFRDNIIMWKNNLTDSIVEEFSTFGSKEFWDEQCDQVRNETDLTTGIKNKNSTLISLTLEKLWKEDKKSDILTKAIEHILDFASNNY